LSKNLALPATAICPRMIATESFRGIFYTKMLGCLLCIFLSRVSE